MHFNMEGNFMTAENTQKEFDDNKAEAFSEKLLTALNYGSLSLMMSIGHRTGIFDAMRALPPSTSEEIARGSSELFTSSAYSGKTKWERTTKI